MDENIYKLKALFDGIKQRGWIESHRKGYTGIGKTFEDLIDKDEENFEIPDFEGIEIKTKRKYTSHTYITLINYTPESKFMDETQRLKDNYGYPDSILKNKKVLNQSVFVNRRAWIGTTYQFELKIDIEKRKIYLYVFDVNGSLIEKESFWSLDILEEKLTRKMNTLALINADSKMMNNKEYLKYSTITFYKFRGVDTFIDLLEKGKIRVSFKIGVFRQGKRFGQAHDHGTSFEIDEKNLILLFEQTI